MEGQPRQNTRKLRYGHRFSESEESWGKMCLKLVQDHHIICPNFWNQTPKPKQTPAYKYSKWLCTYCLYLKPLQVPLSPEANRSQAKVIPRPSWWRRAGQGCGNGAGWSRATIFAKQTTCQVPPTDRQHLSIRALV